jgi:hypothetical protein
MAPAIDQTMVGLAKILDPVVACFTREVAQQVAALQAPPEIAERIAELAEKWAPFKFQLTVSTKPLAVVGW